MARKAVIMTLGGFRVQRGARRTSTSGAALRLRAGASTPATV